MFDSIASRYELVNKLMTLGLDARWRRRAVTDLRLGHARTVLDVAAGTGDFTRELARQGHRPVAVDLSFNMLSVGRMMSERVQADASQLPFRTASFDGLTCGYALRNFTFLEQSLAEMARVLRPGGRLSILEVAEPTKGLWRTGFRLWFHSVVPFIGSLLSDHDAYHYLPASTAYLPDSSEIVAMLNRAGFSAVNNRRILGGLSQQFLATKRS
jgi:demethylmenaquinone methyltransferase/2-methoxy-6-polyprenyl-1,4-benzoquinol methylase